jgi:AraC-like DNA-binding protein
VPLTSRRRLFHVGYESPSQFSREYTRMFGAPPKRDAKQMQTALRKNRATAGAELIAEDA